MDIVPQVVMFLAYREDGSKVRPSDWAERIACSLADKDGFGRMCYSSLVLPACCGGGCGLKVHLKELEEKEPHFYNYLMWFVRTHRIDWITV